MEIDGRTALVTGASGGIGEQFARQLAAGGANLVLLARRGDALRSLQAELLQVHPELTVQVVVADLSEAAGADQVGQQLASTGTVVDLLINNAGVGSHELFVEEDPSALNRQIQLNVVSLVALTALYLPGMLTRGSGAVVNVASTAAFQPVPTMAVYGATKAFVLSFSEALWGETRGSGVRVLALCPGATETAFFDATGKSFLTGRRQSPHQVVAVALRALSGSSPTVVSGWGNRIEATGYRFLPRALMVRISARKVRVTT